MNIEGQKMEKYQFFVFLIDNEKNYIFIKC